MPGTMVDAKCPFCGRQGKVDVSAVGKTARCKCGQNFVVSDAHLGNCPSCGQLMPEGAAHCPACGPGAKRNVAPAEGAPLPYAKLPVTSGDQGVFPREMLDAGETVLLECRWSRSWQNFGLVLNLVFAAAVAAIGFLSAPPGGLLVLGGVVLIWLPAALLAYWARRFTAYAVTNKRVLLRTGILSRKLQSIPPAKITDTTVTQGIMQRVLGCGDVAFNTAGSSKVEMCWRCVDDPYEVAKVVGRVLPR